MCSSDLYNDRQISANLSICDDVSAVNNKFNEFINLLGNTSLKTIGQGAYGAVYLLTTDNATHALKIINIKHLDIILREIKILRSLNHPNIIKYEYYIIDDNSCNIFMEYAKHGNLMDYYTNIIKKKMIILILH